MSKLNILWTNDNVDTAHNMVLMYSRNAKLNRWWDEIDLIIWGATAKLVATDKQIQEKVKLCMEAGVNVLACVSCAINLGVKEDLDNLGIDVKPMGIPLTEILKEDEKLITI